MPALGAVAVGSLFKVSFRQRLFGQRVLNILWYQTDSVVPGIDAWDACIAIAADMNTGPAGLAVQLRALQSEDIAWEEIRVQYYGVDSLPRPYYELNITATGDIASPTPSANVAASIHKRALYPVGQPEKGNGRLQLAGVPGDNILSGMLTDAYQATFSNVCDELADSIALMTGDLEIGPVLVTQTPGAFQAHDIYQCVVKPELRDMRRRTVGLGE